MKIFWKAIKSPRRTNGRHVELVVPEGFEPLRALFFETSESQYVNMLENAVKGMGSACNSAGVIFPGDLDECDDPMNSDEVEIYDALSTVSISQKTFFSILIDVMETFVSVTLADTEMDDLRREVSKSIDNHKSLSGK